MNVVKYNGDIYPELQTKGNSAQFAMPFAKSMLRGQGLDIGCNRPEWSFPEAKLVDITIDDPYHAFHLPEGKYDYIFSSHCLEHLSDWVGALDLWTQHLKKGGGQYDENGGIMFLYLPHYAQQYWRPWNNRKHLSVLQPEMLRDYYESRGFRNIIVTEGYDLNHSFYAVAEL